MVCSNKYASCLSGRPLSVKICRSSFRVSCLTRTPCACCGCAVKDTNRQLRKNCMRAATISSDNRTASASASECFWRMCAASVSTTGSGAILGVFLCPGGSVRSLACKMSNNASKMKSKAMEISDVSTKDTVKESTVTV